MIMKRVIHDIIAVIAEELETILNLIWKELEALMI